MADAAAPVVAVVADDLIWASRLTAAVERGGGRPVRLSSPDALGGEEAARVLVDLTSRRYDGVEAVRAAASRGLRVVAVAQHDDHELRKRALAAGAERVYSYAKVFSDGASVVARWLAR